MCHNLSGIKTSFPDPLFQFKSFQCVFLTMKTLIFVKDLVFSWFFWTSFCSLMLLSRRKSAHLCSFSSEKVLRCAPFQQKKCSFSTFLDLSWLWEACLPLSVLHPVSLSPSFVLLICFVVWPPYHTTSTSTSLPPSPHLLQTRSLCCPSPP